jgi:hypothetical protein
MALLSDTCSIMRKLMLVRMQASVALEGAVAELNASPGSIVDLEGRRIFCSSESAALTVVATGGLLKNGTIALPAGRGLTVDSDCSLQLDSILFEMVRGAGAASSTEQAAMLTLSARAQVTVQSVCLEGAASAACSLDAGAQLTGSGLTIRGACGTAIKVTGGLVAVSRLTAEDNGTGVHCKGGRLTGSNAHFSGNKVAHVVLEDTSSADLVSPTVSCAQAATAFVVSSQSRLVCSAASLTGSKDSMGISGRDAGTQVALQQCSLQGHKCSLRVRSGASATANACTISSSGGIITDGALHASGAQAMASESTATFSLACTVWLDSTSV